MADWNEIERRNDVVMFGPDITETEAGRIVPAAFTDAQGKTFRFKSEGPRWFAYQNAEDANAFKLLDKDLRAWNMTRRMFDAAATM